MTALDLVVGLALAGQDGSRASADANARLIVGTGFGAGAGALLGGGAGVATYMIACSGQRFCELSPYLLAAQFAAAGATIGGIGGLVLASSNNAR